MKYVIDTNVISEITKTVSNDNVLSWFWDHGEDVFLPAIGIEELYYGVLIMPEGKRKALLKGSIGAIVKECADRTLAYDGFSAYLCAELRAKARAMGRSSSIEDFMIAAICKRNDAVLVTHNVKDFDYLGIQVVDPFDYESPVLTRLKREEA